MKFNQRHELDEFRDECVYKAVRGICDGECSEHYECSGECRAVRVVAEDGTDWGWFSYCQSAREVDSGHGFRFVEEIS